MWGHELTKCLQEIFKTGVDGVISDQPTSNKNAIIGDVEDLSKMDLFAPPEGYTVPSIWNDETSEEVTGWFALKNLREIKINPGDFTSTSGKDLLDSLNSRAYMVYCEKAPK